MCTVTSGSCGVPRPSLADYVGDSAEGRGDRRRRVLVLAILSLSRIRCNRTSARLGEPRLEGDVFTLDQHEGGLRPIADERLQVQTL